MKRKVIVSLVLALLCIYFKVNSQTLPNKTLYIHASAGLDRSEDGLKFRIKESASQWTPKGGVFHYTDDTLTEEVGNEIIFVGGIQLGVRF